MKKILLFAMMAAFAFTSCKKDETPDPYEAFKADATPRWENGAKVEKNEESNYTFITDAGGALFSSAAYKTGRISADGSSFEIIEFDGQPNVGKHDSPVLYTHEGAINLHHLEVVHSAGGKLWIVFKETPTSTERRIVH